MSFLEKKEALLKVRKRRKRNKQKGMVLSWENGRLVAFRFRYFDY